MARRSDPAAPDQIIDNDRSPWLDSPRGCPGEPHPVGVNILEHHHPADDSLASALQARAAALRASIAWRAEELVRLVEEGAPRQQIDGVLRALSYLHAKLHVHEIGLRDTGRHDEDRSDA